MGIGGAGHAAHVLGIAALTAAIDGGNGEPGAHVFELLRERAAVAGIAVELHHGGDLADYVRRLQEYAMDARAAHAGVIHVVALGVGDLKFALHQLAAGAKGLHLRYGLVPIGVDVRRPLVATLIFI